jgi:hypothetical protein
MNTQRTQTTDETLAPFVLSDPVLLPVADMAAGVPSTRAHSDGVRVYDLGTAGGGRCDYAREGRTGGYRVSALHLPSISSARGRVIRAHELCHSADTPARRRSDAAFDARVNNTAEDVDIHAVRWPKRRLAHLSRDAAAVALQDIRNVCAAAAAGALEPGTCRDDDYNLSLAVLCRSMGIARGAFNGARPEQRTRIARAVKRGARRARATMGESLINTLLTGVIREIEADSAAHHRKGCAALQALMRFTPPESEDEGAPVDRDGNPIEQPIGDDEEEGGQGGKEHGEGNRHPMRIECLPLIDPCDPCRSRRGRARSGARFNSPRLARCIANRTTSGLFIRTRREAGGAVLIDASGSMHLSADTLAELAAQAPAATVGYYSGHLPDKRGMCGTLRIFARGERRARTAPRKDGGNEVDLWAVRWLLRQPAPRILVSDLGFCGGPDGQSDAAHAEVERARKSGGLIVAKDCEQAREAFQAVQRGEDVRTTDRRLNVMKGY